MTRQQVIIELTQRVGLSAWLAGKTVARLERSSCFLGYEGPERIQYNLVAIDHWRRYSLEITVEGVTKATVVYA